LKVTYLRFNDAKDKFELVLPGPHEVDPSNRQTGNIVDVLAVEQILLDVGQNNYRFRIRLGKSKELKIRISIRFSKSWAGKY